MIFLLSHCAKEGQPPAAISAPDFTLKTLHDEEITLSNLKGKVVLLDFWATWCGPCRESIPHLIQLNKAYQEKGLVTIGMNVDKGDINTVRHFVEATDIPYPVVVATDDVVSHYGVVGLPTSFLIDRSGKIRQKFSGFNPEISKQMTAAVAELTAEQP